MLPFLMAVLKSIVFSTRFFRILAILLMLSFTSLFSFLISSFRFSYLDYSCDLRVFIVLTYELCTLLNLSKITSPLLPA